MLAVTLSKEDVFKWPTNRNVPGACAIQAYKKFLALLIKLAEVKKVEKVENAILTSQWNGKTRHKRVSNFDVFNVFHHCEPFASHLIQKF